MGARSVKIYSRVYTQIKVMRTSFTVQLQILHLHCMAKKFPRSLIYWASCMSDVRSSRDFLFIILSTPIFNRTITSLLQSPPLQTKKSVWYLSRYLSSHFGILSWANTSCQLFILLSSFDTILGLVYLRQAPDLTHQRTRYQRYTQD